MSWSGGDRHSGRLNIVPRRNDFSGSWVVESRRGGELGRGAESSQKQQCLWQSLIMSV